MSDGRRTPWGLVSIALMALVALAFGGAAVYRWQGSTRVVRERFAPGDALYAAVDRTAPWSEPWTELCALDPRSGRDRWCRSLPVGSATPSVDALDETTLVVMQDGLRTGLWLLASADGSTLFGPDLVDGHPDARGFRWARSGGSLVVAWPPLADVEGRRTAPATLRAIDLRSGALRWAVPLDDAIDPTTLRALDGRLTIRASDTTYDVAPSTGALHAQ